MSLGFSSRSDTNLPVQPQMARGMNFPIQEEECLHNICSEGKDADQMHGYPTIRLHLCFSICKNTNKCFSNGQNQDFSWHSLNISGLICITGHIVCRYCATAFGT